MEGVGTPTSMAGGASDGSAAPSPGGPKVIPAPSSFHPAREQSRLRVSPRQVPASEPASSCRRCSPRRLFDIPSPARRRAVALAGIVSHALGAALRAHIAPHSSFACCSPDSLICRGGGCGRWQRHTSRRPSRHARSPARLACRTRRSTTLRCPSSTRCAPIPTPRRCPLPPQPHTIWSACRGPCGCPNSLDYVHGLPFGKRLCVIARRCRSRVPQSCLSEPSRSRCERTFL